MQNRIAVVTGGTGIVGAGLVRHLKRLLPEHQIRVLTRGNGADITRPDLGLPAQTLAELQANTTLIVHCAADTRFNLSIADSRRINLDGTRHMLDFAAGCANLEQFAHVGTLYIAGRRPGLVTEAPLRHDHGYVNTYEQSKHEAEELVLAERRFPVGVYRLSSVVEEDSEDGHFRQVIRFAPWADQFRFFPADPTVTVDIIDAAWTSLALATLVVKAFEPGCIRHICAGTDGCVTVEEIVDRLFGDSRRRPTFLPLARFERIAGGAVGRALDSLMTYLPHLSIQQPFDATHSARLLAMHGVDPPDTYGLLDRVLTQQLKTS